MMMAPMGNSSLVNRRSGFHGEIEDSSAIPDAIGYPVEFSAGNQVVCRYAAFQSVFLLPFPLPAAGLYPAAIGKADGAEISSFIPKRSHRVCFGDFLQTKALINCRAKLKLMAVCFRMKKDQ